MNDSEKKSKIEPPTLPGLACIGCIAVGVVGLCVALMAAGRGQFGAAGGCLIASALAFGFLANASFRR